MAGIERQRQNIYELKTSPSYIVRACFKETERKEGEKETERERGAGKIQG